MAGSDTGTSSAESPLDALSPEAIMSSFSQVRDSISSSMADLVQQAGSFSSAITQNKAGVQAASEAQQGIDTVKAAAESKSLAEQRGAAADFGANRDAQNYVMRTMADQVIGDQNELDQRADEIKGLQSKTLLDDPLGYFEGVFTLPSKIAAYNTLENKKNTKLATINQLEDAAKSGQQIAATDNQVDALTNLSNVNKATAAKATIAASQADQELAKFNTNMVSLRTDMDYKSFQAALSTNSSIVQLRDLALNEQRLQIEKDREPFYEMAKKEQAIKLEGIIADQEQLRNNLKRITPFIGHDISPAEYRALPIAQRTVINDVMFGYKDSTGQAFADTASTISALRNAPFISLGPGVDPIKNKLMNEYTTIAARPENAAKKPVELEGILQKEFGDAYRKELSNIPSEGGIFSPAPLATTLQYAPAFKNTQLYAKLAPLANPQQDTRADDVLAAANSMVKDNIAPAVAAQQVSDLYKIIQNQNNELHNYGRLAIPFMGGDPKFPGFKTAVRDIGYANNASKILDMANPAAVESYLTQQKIFDAAQIKLKPAADAQQMPTIPRLLPNKEDLQNFRKPITHPSY